MARFGEPSRARRELYADTSRATTEQLAADPVLAADRRFNDNFAAIKAARDKSSDKSWERAYKEVTGFTWPKGYDIKINPSGVGGYVQKDPEVLKKAARNAAIAGGAVLAGGTALGLGGGAAPAAGGATATAPTVAPPIAGVTLPAATETIAPVIPGVTLPAATQVGIGAAPGASASAAGTGAGAASSGAAASGAGGGPGAGGAPGVAPSRSWLGPLLDYGIPVAGTVIGSAIANHANNKAIEAENARYAEALAFEKQAYSDLRARLEPYIAAGANTSDRQAALLGVSPTRTFTEPPHAQPAADDGVWMQAPDGTRERVKREMVDFFKSKGATLLGGGR